MRFTDFTYEELRELAPQGQAVFIPLGCTEQQGPHMTVDFDAMMISRLCDDISERLEQAHGIKTLVLPTLPFGPTPEHEGFGHGFVNLRQSTHEAVVEDILESLAAQGFSRLLVWGGCGQHELGFAVERFNATHTGLRAYQPVIDYHAISGAALGDVPGGHADSFATSICLLLDASRVREDRIRRPRNGPIDWTQPVDFAATSDTGVVGDPTRATRDAGEHIWRLCVEEGARSVVDILAGTPIRKAWHFKEP